LTIIFCVYNEIFSTNVALEESVPTIKASEQTQIQQKNNYAQIATEAAENGGTNTHTMVTESVRASGDVHTQTYNNSGLPVSCSEPTSSIPPVVS